MNRSAAADRPRFFENEQNVAAYLAATADRDNRQLLQTLKKHLSPGATVLELGIGGGRDLEILSESYRATGSDISEAFLQRFRQIHPNADLLRLDAANPQTDRCFDAIYSNKVLHHLPRSALPDSLRRQSNLLNAGGILFHTFWRGRQDAEFMDLHFVRYQIGDLRQIARRDFRIIRIGLYPELVKNDSIFIILGKT